jgi:hypothetical protein
LILLLFFCNNSAMCKGLCKNSQIFRALSGRRGASGPDKPGVKGSR